MKKTAVVYWSSTGNTEAMAQAVLEGMKEAGAEAVLLTPDAVDAGALAGMDAIAFGCPAMGSEVLEECEFEPMFSGCKNRLGGKSVGLFGSYGWGDGQWMRDWEKDCDDGRRRTGGLPGHGQGSGGVIFSMSHRLKNRLSTLALALGLCLLAAAVKLL